MGLCTKPIQVTAIAIAKFEGRQSNIAIDNLKGKEKLCDILSAPVLFSTIKYIWTSKYSYKIKLIR